MAAGDGFSVDFRAAKHAVETDSKVADRLTDRIGIRQQVADVALRVEGPMSAPITKAEIARALHEHAAQLDEDGGSDEMPLDAWREWCAWGLDLDAIYDAQDERAYFGKGGRR